jgi:multidrug efflux pump subunit AcrB
MTRPGVKNAVAFVGLDGATFTNAPNGGVVFVTLSDFKDREKLNLTGKDILNDLRRQMFSIAEAFPLVIEPPAVPGIGTGGGLKGYVQDRGGRGLRALEGSAWIVAGSAAQTPGLAQAYTLFSTRTPQVYADIDRTKSEMLGVPIGRVFEALSIYMGSAFVNDFNILGRTYRVTAQADNPYRLDLRDVANIKTRNVDGEMVPIGSVANFSNITGAYRVGTGLFVRPGHCGHRKNRPRAPALGLRLRMDGNRAAGEAGRQYRHRGLRTGGAVRLSVAGRPVRELDPALGRAPDRADVYLRGDDRGADRRT